MKELSNLIFEAQGVSQEAFMAQRMAELAQMAKYRALKLQEYIDWSDPVKRAAKIAAAEADLLVGKAKFNKNSDPKLFEHVSVRRYELMKHYEPPAISFLPDISDCPKVTLIKLTMCERFKLWFKRG